jgi:hypothetical protein
MADLRREQDRDFARRMARENNVFHRLSFLLSVAIGGFPYLGAPQGFCAKQR